MGSIEVAVDRHANELNWPIVGISVPVLAKELREDFGPMEGLRDVERDERTSNGGVDEDEVSVVPSSPVDGIQPVSPSAEVQAVVLLAEHSHVVLARKLKNESDQENERPTKKTRNHRADGTEMEEGPCTTKR